MIETGLRTYTSQLGVNASALAVRQRDNQYTMARKMLF